MRIEDRAGCQALFEEQGKARWAIASTDAATRIAKLKKLRGAMIERQGELYEALWADFHKGATEAWITEVFPTLEEIDYATKHLRKWMRDKRAGGVFFLPGAKSRLRYEPKGRVLILAPWNYPFQLSMAPLVSAIAAGDVAVLKPSNKTPATSAFIASLLESIFPREEVAVAEGKGSVVGDMLLELPFDHVFFTGSPKVGARVGEAAARVHAGLTLELGGKSPTIILRGANLRDAAEKIMWAKCLNAGQTCIAPDYLYCPRELADEFAAEAKKAVERMYGPDEAAREASADFPRIVDKAACEKHKALVEDAVAKGAKLAFGGRFDVAQRYAAPTLLVGVSPSMAIMDEEIFGPLLPVIPYDSVQEAVDFIRSRPKPLSLYAFGEATDCRRELLDQTTSGSACVNDLIIQIENLAVPFGGVGMSGTGNYHGFFGFKTFSHERNYMVQGPISMLKGLYPPYDRPAPRRLKSMLETLLGSRP